MTKQEAIQQAYGEHFELCNPNADGWSLNVGSPASMRLQISTEVEINQEYYRPKSLQGIENNNGWIKIESDNDLPKNETMYWASNGNYVYNYCYSKDEFLEDYRKDKSLFTHYQPIVKPQPPIY